MTSVRKSYGCTGRRTVNFQDSTTGPVSDSFPSAARVASTTSSTLSSARASATSSRGGGGGFANSAPKRAEDVAKLIKYIDDNIIGKNNAFLGPFGRRKVVFCDYTASGRSLQFIEDYILREVLPLYGNTHSTTNITSLQSSLFRQEARDIIKSAVNASEDDAVIFVGHGCSGAVRKLVNALELIEPPIVFVGASEHQDNLQIWQEIGAKIIRIVETKQNFLDLDDLAEQLALHQQPDPQSPPYDHSTDPLNLNNPVPHPRQLIGCFAATSSVSGVLVDDVAATMLLHQYGALAFWDYNVAAPYVPLDMNPKVPGLVTGTGSSASSSEGSGGEGKGEQLDVVFKDAMYFSGHKFVGGVQTPGILVAKKSLFKTTTSCEPDGFFALHQQHYKNFEVQEEGTSAAVIESVRAGLVMQLKETVTAANILTRQEKITKQFLQHVRTIPEVILLGNSSPGLKRIPVFSFMVRHPRGTFLHHNFVVAILNDVFGIQARGGCPCSAPYAQDLLGIDDSLAAHYENIILEERRLSSLNLAMESAHLELLRPGFTRISLPYFISDGELAFIMEAVKMVATEGWKLLPQYMIDLSTGEWRHHTNSISKDRMKWLGSIRYVDGKMTMNERRISGPGIFPQSYSECLQTARNLFNRARKMANRHHSTTNFIEDRAIIFDSRAEKLRWFMLQHEAQDILTSNSQNIKHTVPFNPIGFSGSKRNEDKATIVPSTASSPRHFSLPAIDDHRVMTCSSPVPYFMQDVTSYYYTTTHGPVNFSVGEPVNSAILNPIPQSNNPFFFRERCMSLGASNASPPILSPQTMINLGMNGQTPRQRYASYNSAVDYQSLDSDPNNTSPTHSLNLLSSSFEQRNNRMSPQPDMHTYAYVKEMTKELATNIKSEIREVINTVEDCLENTDSVDISYSFEKHGSGSEDDGRSDSISANEVAEYLKEVSKEMANEVKYEIRDVVNSVDEYFTPDKNRSWSRGSSSGESEKSLKLTIERKEPTVKYSPGSSSETVINMINKSNSTTRLSDSVEKAGYKPKLLSSTVTSLSSQDSGINLTFHDGELLSDNRRSSSESSTSRSTLERIKPKLQRHCESDIELMKVNSDCSIVNNDCPKVNNDSPEVNTDCPNVNTDRPKGNNHGLKVNTDCLKVNGDLCQMQRCVKETVDTYEMIKNGDKVLVCLSGGQDSLSLLHSLLEYQSMVGVKGVEFQLGAATVDPESAGCDPCVLIGHLKSLGVPYVMDEQSQQSCDKDEFHEDSDDSLISFSSSTVRHRLYSTAKSGGYNVLAIGQNFDDLVEGFVISMFDRGKLSTLKAHYYIKEHHLRVIRPFINLRASSILNYHLNAHIPPVTLTPNTDVTPPTSPTSSAIRQHARHLLAEQAAIYPDLYANLRSALRPLIGFRAPADCDVDVDDTGDVKETCINSSVVTMATVKRQLLLQRSSAAVAGNSNNERIN